MKNFNAFPYIIHPLYDMKKMWNRRVIFRTFTKALRAILHLRKRKG